ncbi:hypothetical protein ACTVCO_09040 [Sanguibacter sp. A247]|uniref:hypothetical protein n=1 Tax=unclassified Sanguibacter TaxID=2645534 RepID=UPI003FD7B264
MSSPVQNGHPVGGPGRAERGTAARAFHAAVVVAFLGAPLGLAGCASPSAAPPRAAPSAAHQDELRAADGRPCPAELPLGEDPGGYGFGIERGATERPRVQEPQSAWVCRYEQTTLQAPDVGHAPFAWILTDGPTELEAEHLGPLTSALNDLAPFASDDVSCTADLGPRWMVVTSHEGDLTAVVVDDFGCHMTRLSDNPQTTPPGAAGHGGAVGGVLDGGTAILAAIQAELHR